MKITLVRPTYGSRFQVTPPLGLGYMSMALKQNEFKDIDLVDGSLHLYSPEEALAKVARSGRPDIIGIQVYTGSHKWAKDFVGLVKEKYPDQIILLGGPHITALKKFALKFIGAEYGIAGEGENAIVQFARCIEDKTGNFDEVEGLIYLENGVYKQAQKHFGFFDDPDSIPYPDWELLKPQQYFQYMEGATVPLMGKRPTPILTSRGCPFKCTFCSSGLTNKRIMRYRSPENIVSEIKYLKENYGVDEVFFSDDNLTLNIRRAERIFELILEENLNIHWRAPNGIRVDRLSEELVYQMKKSGGYYVGVGVESGNPRVLKQIKKRLDLDTVRENVALLHNSGILVSGFFICGLISETEEEIKDSIDFALSTKFDRIQVSDYVPYPGSEDFETVFKSDNEAEFERKLMEFQESETVPEFRDLDLESIIKLQKKFVLKFYLRPRMIFSMIKNLKKSQVMAILKHPYVRRWFVRDKKWFAS